MSISGFSVYPSPWRPSVNPYLRVQWESTDDFASTIKVFSIPGGALLLTISYASGVAFGGVIGRNISLISHQSSFGSNITVKLYSGGSELASGNVAIL